MKTAALTIDIRADSAAFNAALAKVKANVKRTAGAMSLPPGIRQMSSAVGGVAKQLGSRAFTFGFYGAVAGVAGLTSAVVRFDDASKKAYSNFYAGGEKGQVVMDQLNAITSEVGKATEFSPAGAAEGAAALAKAGYNVGEMSKMLPMTADLASAASVDIATAAEWATNSLNMFGLRTSDSNQTAKNFSRVADVVSFVVAQGKMDFSEFNNTLEYTGTVARGLELELEDVAGSIGLMSTFGLKGSKAGTNLRSMYLRLANPTGEVAKKMKELNVNAWDPDTKKFRGVATVMAELNGAMTADGMGVKDRIALLAQMFPKTAMPGASSMSTMDMAAVDEYLKKLQNVKGLTTKMANIQRSSIGNQIERFWGNLEAVAIKTMQKFRPQIDGFLADITKWADEIDPEEIAKFFRIIWSGVKEMIPPLRDAMPQIMEFSKGALGVMIQMMKILGPILKTITPYLEQIAYMWMAFQFTKLISGLRTVAIAAGELFGTLRTGAGIVAAIAGALTPVGWLVMAFATAISICSIFWDDWIASLKTGVPWMENLAGLMEEVSNNINNIAGFFGWNLFDDKQTREEFNKQSQAQWKKDKAAGIDVSNPLYAYKNSGGLPKGLDYFMEKFNGGGILQYQTPFVPQSNKTGDDPFKQGFNSGPSDGTGSSLEQAIRNGQLASQPIINVTANDGVQVATSVQQSRNTTGLVFNGGGKN